MARDDDLAASGLHPLWLLRIPAPGLRPGRSRPVLCQARRAVSFPAGDGPRPYRHISVIREFTFLVEGRFSEAVHLRLVELGPDDQYLMLHEELGPSSYDVHDDGTDVTHVSSRQPNLFMRTTNRHFEGYVSDLFLIDWREHVGADYEVATDADLHAGGARLLDDVTVVITGTHPEYVSEREFDALAQFQGNGGRVMYLGGNGFQSRVTFNPDRPHIMESRPRPLLEVPARDGERRTPSGGSLLLNLGGHLSAIGCEARLLARRRRDGDDGFRRVGSLLACQRLARWR